MVICTLCSCFPWPVARTAALRVQDPDVPVGAAREPRKVAREVGVDMTRRHRDQGVGLSGHSRWFVIPEGCGDRRFHDEIS